MCSVKSKTPDPPATRWHGHAVLLVPVPALEGFVAGRTRFYDPSFLSTDPDFPQAHITIMAPFDRVPDMSRLDAVAAQIRAFNFELRRMDVFPDGLIHLRPSPEEPFHNAITAAQREFPEIRAYGHPAPIPHLSLDRCSDTVTASTTGEAVAGLLPARSRAERLQLCWYESGACRVLHQWTLS